MSQVLVLEGKKFEVETIFEDPGQPPTFGLVGGQRTLLDPGQPGHPRIAQKGDGFFYLESTGLVPVSNAEHVGHLPEPFRKKALQFIDRMRNGRTKLTTANDPRRVSQTKRGRPRKEEVRPEEVHPRFGRPVKKDEPDFGET